MRDTLSHKSTPCDLTIPSSMWTTKGGCNREPWRGVALTLFKEFSHDVLVMLGSLYFFRNVCSGISQVFCNKKKHVKFEYIVKKNMDLSVLIFQ